MNAAGFCEAASYRKTIERNILVVFFFFSFNIRTTLGLFILESSHNEKKELGFGNLRLTQSRISPIQTTFLQRNVATKLCTCWILNHLIFYSWPKRKMKGCLSRGTWVSLALINASYFSLPGNHKHFSQTSQGILTVLAVCWVPDSISPSYSHHLLSILLVPGHFIEKQMSPPLISHSDLRRKDIFLNI